MHEEKGVNIREEDNEEPELAQESVEVLEKSEADEKNEEDNYTPY